MGQRPIIVPGPLHVQALDLGAGPTHGAHRYRLSSLVDGVRRQAEADINLTCS